MNIDDELKLNENNTPGVQNSGDVLNKGKISVDLSNSYLDAVRKEYEPVNNNKNYLDSQIIQPKTDDSPSFNIDIKNSEEKKDISKYIEIKNEEMNKQMEILSDNNPSEIIEILDFDEEDEEIEYDDSQIIKSDYSKIEGVRFLGKNERNLINKILLLKKIEIYDLICNLMQKEKLPASDNGLVRKMITKLIEVKYIKQYNFVTAKTTAAVNKIISQTIEDYCIELINSHIKRISKQKIKNYKNYLLVANKLDSKKPNIKNIVEHNDLIIFNGTEKIIKDLMNTKEKYNEMYKLYFKKIGSKRFELIQTELSNQFENFYNTNLKININFSKSCSNYIINKTFEKEDIIEDLRYIQLRLIATEVLQDNMNMIYDKKYLINFPIELYSKPKNIIQYFSCVSDEYSQNKIYYIVNKETLMTKISALSKLKKQGFKFICELKFSDVDNNSDLKKNLSIIDYLILVKNDDIFSYDSIPLNLWNNIIYTKGSIIKEVIVE